MSYLSELRKCLRAYGRAMAKRYQAWESGRFDDDVGQDVFECKEWLKRLHYLADRAGVPFGICKEDARHAFEDLAV